MPNLALERIPQRGPWKTYQGWLDWKIKNLPIGEIIKLPIFSAIQVERIADGFVVMFNGKAYGFTDGQQVLAYMQQDVYQPCPIADRIAKAATVKYLRQQNATQREIAKALGIPLSSVNYYLNRTLALNFVV